jgi:hypothetical protein
MSRRASFTAFFSLLALTTSAEVTNTRIVVSKDAVLALLAQAGDAVLLATQVVAELDCRSTTAYGRRDAAVALYDRLPIDAGQLSDKLVDLGILLTRYCHRFLLSSDKARRGGLV